MITVLNNLVDIVQNFLGGFLDSVQGGLLNISSQIF